MYPKVGEMLGTITHARSGGQDYGKIPGVKAVSREVSVNAPATPEAQQWDGWGTALKPAYEPIILAMKPTEETFAENALKWGVGGLNIDGSRIEAPGWLIRGGRHTGSAPDPMDRDSGKIEDSDRSLEHPGGRWPANLLVDDSEEVQNLFSVGSASRLFYTAKASTTERNDGDNVNNNHPTVKPIALLHYLLTLVTMPQYNLILDPFMGSGTTLRAAKDLGRKTIGIEIEERYCEIAAKRMSQSVMNLQMDV